MNNGTLPMDLYKANVQLQLSITRLLQESGHSWLETAREFSAEGVAETTAQIENLLRAGDWQSLATLPSEVFWRMLQGQLGDARTMGQIAVRSQTAFTSGLQEALTSWQQAVSAALGGRTDSAASVTGVLNQWMQTWAPAGAAGRGQADK